MRKIINFILFYIGWYLAVSMHSLPGALLSLLIAIGSIIVMQYSVRTVLIMFCLACCGILNDFIAFKFNIYQFTTTKVFLDLQNLWLFSLWILFVGTFGASLAYLQKFSVYVLMLLGACGGVLSYYLAFELQAISFNNLLANLAYICANWAILFPVLFKCYNRLSIKQ